MNIPYSENYIFEPQYLPITFPSPRSSKSPSVSSYLQYNSNLKCKAQSYRNQFIKSPEPVLRRGLESKPNQSKRKKTAQNETMNNLKNSLMDIKQDVSRLIEQHDFSDHYQHSEKIFLTSNCQDPYPQLKRKKTSMESPDGLHKKSCLQIMKKKSSQLQGIKKYSCVSERNSSSEHQTIQQIQHGLNKYNQQQSSHQNHFSTPKISPINFMNQQQSTQSSQISKNSQESYSNSQFQKLLAENVANKQAIKYLQKIVHENQESRKELEFQVNLLNNSSREYQTQKLLKLENYKLSQLLNQQRYIRSTLEKKLSIHQMKIESLRNSQYFSDNNPELITSSCNCQYSRNHEKQMQMIQESYKTEVMSLQTQIKLVKIVLQNYLQKSHKVNGTKNVYIQTDIYQESFVSSADISAKQLKQEMDMIRNDTIKIISQKQGLEQKIHKLLIENMEIKEKLEEKSKSQTSIAYQCQRQDVISLIQQLAKQQQKYTFQLAEVDAYCVQLQEQNTQLKSKANPSRQSKLAVLFFQKQIEKLNQQLNHKNIKIEYLQQKLMSLNDKESSDFQIEKINLIIQIKQIQNNFRSEIQFLKKQLEIAIISCENLTQKGRQMYQEIRIKDDFILNWLDKNIQHQSSENITKVQQQCLYEIQNCFNLDRILSNTKLIQQLKQQNKMLSDFIDEHGINRIDSFITF